MSAKNYFWCILLMILCFFIGHISQAMNCHNALSTGEKYVVIISEEGLSKFYLLGKEIPKPTTNKRIVTAGMQYIFDKENELQKLKEQGGY